MLTALVGLLLLSITLNAERKGKIFRRLKKRSGSLFFSSNEKHFTGSLKVKSAMLNVTQTALWADYKILFT